MERTAKSYHAGLYCRLSRDDAQLGESSSISTQKAILTSYCVEQGYPIHDFYIDDGVSGLTFDRPGFKRLLTDIESGLVDLVITKDLSRLGRDYIMMGYYTEIYFPTKDVRYLALSDGFDSDKEANDIAPFMNILNDMYARDVSRKVKAAKFQRAKQGLFTSGQGPYGYRVEKGKLVPDLTAAENVRLIFQLAMDGYGNVRIAQELEARRIKNPGAYKNEHQDARFARYGRLDGSAAYVWCPATINDILTNPVYLGTLVSHRTEVLNYKTKLSRSVPKDQQIITEGAHAAIIPEDLFHQVQMIRAHHRCPAAQSRENLFRGLLFCDCCGHPLSIAHRKLKYREEDQYRCMHHYYHPEDCPKTHAIYHEMLYGYVLKEIQTLGKSMHRRKIQSPISEYKEITALTPEILHAVIERIEIGHVSRKAQPKRVIQIRWKLT